MRWRLVLPIGAAVLWLLWFAFWPVPETSSVTATNYERIQEGMTLPEVESLLGGPPGDYSGERAEIISTFITVSGNHPWTKGEVRTWHGERVTIAVLIPDDGKVTLKRCSSTPYRESLLRSRVRTILVGLAFFFGMTWLYCSSGWRETENIPT